MSKKNRTIALVVLGVISLASLAILKVEAKDIILAISGGIVGALTFSDEE